MRLNRLKMNDKKMEFIMFGNNRQLDKCTTKEITIGEDVIQRAEVIKLLGVKLNKNISFKENIMDKCRKVTLNLHNIRKIRNSLDSENTKNLICTGHTTCRRLQFTPHGSTRIHIKTG